MCCDSSKWSFSSYLSQLEWKVKGGRPWTWVKTLRRGFWAVTRSRTGRLLSEVFTSCLEVPNFHRAALSVQSRSSAARNRSRSRLWRLGRWPRSCKEVGLQSPVFHHGSSEVKHWPFLRLGARIRSRPDRFSGSNHTTANRSLAPTPPLVQDTQAVSLPKHGLDTVASDRSTSGQQAIRSWETFAMPTCQRHLAQYHFAVWLSSLNAARSFATDRGWSWCSYGNISIFTTVL